jgi:hypothetical protein
MVQGECTQLAKTRDRTASEFVYTNPHRFARAGPLSIEYGTYKTAYMKFWPGLSGEFP